MTDPGSLFSGIVRDMTASEHDTEQFCKSLCDAIQNLVTSLRRLIRIHSDREEERTLIDRQSHEIKDQLSSLLPSLNIASKLSFSSRYHEVSSLASCAFELLRVILKFLITIQKHELLEQSLVEVVTLIVPLCLRYEPFLSTASEQEVGEDVILELIKSHGMELGESVGGQLLNQLLDSCVSVPPHRLIRNHSFESSMTHKPIPTPDSNLSDQSLELSFSNDHGYEADVESKEASIEFEALQVHDQWNLICFPRLAYTLLELLTCNQMRVTKKTSDTVLIRVLDKLIDWCRDNLRNSIILYDAGFSELIIQSIRDVMSPSASPSDQIILKFSSLFTVISKFRLQGSDLRSFLSLFTSGSQPSYQLLINCLSDIFKMHDTRSPCLWITGSYTADPYVSSKSENSHEARMRKAHCEKRNLSCCWTDALVAVPLPDTCWPAKHISVSFWFKMQGVLKKAKQKGLSNGSSSSIVSSIHLLSVCLGELSLEVWYCLKKKVLKFRLLSFHCWLLLFEMDETDPKMEETAFPQDEWLHFTMTFTFETEARVTKSRLWLNGVLRSMTCFDHSTTLNPKLKAQLFMLFGSASSQLPPIEISCAKVFQSDLTESDVGLLFLMGPSHPLLILSHEMHILPEFPADCHLVKQSFVRAFAHRRERIAFLRENVVAEFPLLNQSSGLNCLLANGKFDQRTNQRMHPSTTIVPIASPTMFAAPNHFRHILHLPFALNNSGGIASQLYLFGTIIEKTSDPKLYSQALKVLLSAINVHPEIGRDFLVMSGYEMVNQAIQSGKCVSSRQLFETYLNHCIIGCGTEVLLRAPECLRSLYRLWRKWHQLPEVVALIYDTILSLIQPCNHWWEFNLFQLRQINIMKEVICMLETCSIENPDLMAFSSRDVFTLSRILKMVIGSPPKLHQISSLVNCLILLHDSNRAYVCQSRKNLYFLLDDSSSEDPNRFSSQSIASADEWQMIRPSSRTSHLETTHTIVFSGLLNTLNDVISDLLPPEVPKVLGPIVGVDHFMIWSNNENGVVRDLVLKTLLTSLKQSHASQFIDEFASKEGFQLLSNQMAQYPVSTESMSCLITFILDADRINLCLEDWTFARNWLKLSSVQASAFQALMSLLLKSQEDVALAHWSLQCLYKLLKNIPNCSHILKFLHDNGLVICLVNILKRSSANLQSRSDLQLDEDVIERDILSILELLSSKLISSSGNIFREALSDAIDVFLLHSLGLGPKRDMMRQSLIMFLKTAFEAIDKHTSLQKFASNSSFRVAEDSVDSVDKETSSRTSDGSGTGCMNLSRDETDVRLRLIVERSIEAISFRDVGSQCSDSEKFFVRTLLHTLFLNSVGQDSSGRWLPSVNPFRKFLRSKLSLLVVIVLSPLYSINDRIQFALWISQSIPVDLTCCLSHKQLHVIQSFSPAIRSNCRSEEKEILNRCLSFKHKDKSSDSDSWLETMLKRKDVILSRIRSRHQMHYSQFERLAERLGDISLTVTQSFVHEQNQERVKFFAFTKERERCTYITKRKWKKLVQSVYHEAHHFHDEVSFPQSWQLDPSEGPSRMRRKLMRCHLDIDSKFFVEEFQCKSKCSNIQIPLSYIHSTTDQDTEISILIDSIHANEQILETYVCALIVPRHDYSGEILLSDTCAHFIGRVDEHHHCSSSSHLRKETWMLTDVKEFLERRYQLQDKALEIFLENGNSYLLAFKSSSEMKCILSFFSERGISQTTELTSLTGVTKLWRDGHITNFDYLMFLNKLGGRSFNDLMIYPVYPFVLSDYKNDVLDLTSPESFRNFAKPMALQQKSREKYYKDQYQYLLSEYNRRRANDDVTLDPVSCPVYHYGSHYSNSGTVLHWLVRLPPYTQMFLHYQDKSFDIPDRTFHSMNIAWDLSSGGSTTDFKELTPEFFYLPEFLMNLEKFNFGTRHNGIRVDDVNLPPWSRSDPRLFVLINRQALESDHVSRNLHLWIDLIFGYKQSGKHAIEAVNVFHPATYYGLEVNNIEDSLKRNALITMIRTFGQMPKQLFKHPHSQRLPPAYGMQDWLETPHVLGEVNGLKWGNFVGSPTESEPVIVFSTANSSFRGTLVPLPTNDIFGLPIDSCLLVSYNYVKNRKSTAPPYISSLAVVSWNHSDGMIRVRDRMGRILMPFQSSCLDQIAMCASSSSQGLLLVSYLSGSIAVYSVPATYGSARKEEEKPLQPLFWLFAHTSLVTAISLNKEFRVIVTCDEDGYCILWDLNTFTYTRTLCRHENPVALVCISSTLGDIATVSQMKHESRLIVCTINGQLVNSLQAGRKVTSICYSSCPEGVSVNVLVTGFSDGVIQMWSSWDLTPVRVLCDPHFVEPITSLCFFLDDNYLCAMNSEGGLRIWGKKGNPVVTSNPVTIL